MNSSVVRHCMLFLLLLLYCSFLVEINFSFLWSCLRHATSRQCRNHVKFRAITAFNAPFDYIWLKTIAIIIIMNFYINIHYHDYYVLKLYNGFTDAIPIRILGKSSWQYNCISLASEIQFNSNEIIILLNFVFASHAPMLDRWLSLLLSILLLLLSMFFEQFLRKLQLEDDIIITEYLLFDYYHDYYTSTSCSLCNIV